MISQSFESFADETILAPLGMKNTGYNYTDDVINNMAQGYPFPLLDLGWENAAGNKKRKKGYKNKVECIRLPMIWLNWFLCCLERIFHWVKQKTKFSMELPFRK